MSSVGLIIRSAEAIYFGNRNIWYEIVYSPNKYRETEGIKDTRY